MDAVQLSQGYGATMRRLFIIQIPESLVLKWLTSEGWKAELTLEPPCGFEPRATGFLDWESSAFNTRPMLH